MAQQQLIPFGKYKGQPLETLQADPGYVQWLQEQSWVKDKWPQLYTVIINNFGEPEETPEHNAFQMLFLQDPWCVSVFYAYYNIPLPSVSPYAIQSLERNFEVSGFDVFLRFRLWRYAKHLIGLSEDDQLDWCLSHQEGCASYRRNGCIAAGRCHKSLYERPKIAYCDWHVDEEWHHGARGRFWIELKPTLSDNYPAVLRQIRAARHKQEGQVVLLINDFSATGASFADVQAFFALAQIRLLRSADLQAHKGHAQYATRPDYIPRSALENTYD